jgi:hypothetical protein
MRSIKWDGLKNPDYDLVTKRASGYWDVVHGVDGWVIYTPLYKKTGRDEDRIVVGHVDREVARLRAEELIRKEERVYVLDAEQFAALRTFADANGRDWKSKLNHAWSSGRYRDYNGTDNYGYLQQVRNTFGPSWLVKFSFDNAKTHSRKL